MLGRKLLNAPVPGYAETVSAATDRVMGALTPERPLWRRNWSLLDSPALYQPVRVALEKPLEPEAFRLEGQVWVAGRLV